MIGPKYTCKIVHISCIMVISKSIVRKHFKSNQTKKCLYSKFDKKEVLNFLQNIASTNAFRTKDKLVKVRDELAFYELQIAASIL